MPDFRYREAAKYLNVGVGTIRRRVREGWLRSYKSGTALTAANMIPAEDIYAFSELQRAGELLDDPRSRGDIGRQFEHIKRATERTAEAIGWNRIAEVARKYGIERLGDLKPQDFTHYLADLRRLTNMLKATAPRGRRSHKGYQQKASTLPEPIIYADDPRLAGTPKRPSGRYRAPKPAVPPSWGEQLLDIVEQGEAMTSVVGPAAIDDLLRRFGIKSFKELRPAQMASMRACFERLSQGRRPYVRDFGVSVAADGMERRMAARREKRLAARQQRNHAAA